MDLWIRSQDREVLTKINDIQLDVHSEKEWEIKCNLDNKTSECYILGIYKSKERALEVLDEIQNILKSKIMIRMDKNVGKVANFLNINGEYVQNTGNADIKNINNSYVYKMPKE